MSQPPAADQPSGPASPLQPRTVLAGRLARAAGAQVRCVAAVPPTLSVPVVAAPLLRARALSALGEPWVVGVPHASPLDCSEWQPTGVGLSRNSSSFQWRKPRRAAQEVGCTRTFFSQELWDAGAWRTRPCCSGRRAPETLQRSRWRTRAPPRAHPPLPGAPRHATAAAAAARASPSSGAKQGCTRGERHTPGTDA